MRNLHLLVCLVIFELACRSKATDVQAFQFRRDTVELKSGFGSIILDIPVRYDTLLLWTNRFDCISCGFEQYRFQNNSNPIYLETGYYWKGDPKDSVDEVTIKHGRVKFPDSSRREISEQDHFFNVNSYSKDPDLHPLVWDSMLKVNSRNFSVVFSDTYDSLTSTYRKVLIASTVFRGNDITIVYKRFSRYQVSREFLENVMKSLRSVEFCNGH